MNFRSTLLTGAQLAFLLISCAFEPAGADENKLLFKQGEEAFSKGKLGVAASYMSTILSKDSRFAAAHNLLGKIYHKQSKNELAINEYKLAISSDPQFLEAKYNLGLLYFDDKNYAEAVKYLEEACRKTNSAEHECNLALCYERLGQMDKALAGFKKALKLEPHNAHAHYCLGRLYQLEKNNAAAIEAYKQAIADNPKYVEAYNNLGVAYQASGRLAESVQAFGTALKLDPDCLEAQRNLGYAHAHTSLGITYFQGGNLNKALEEYKHALKIDPAFADAHYNLAILFQKEGKLQLAVGHYQAAIKYAPQNAKAHNNLGVAYAKLGRIDLAEAEYRQALQLSPEYAEAKENLQMLLNAKSGT